MTWSSSGSKGHAGHAENERCDALATSAADDPSRHQEDAGFRSWGTAQGAARNRWLAGAGRGGNPVSPHLSVLHVCR